MLWVLKRFSRRKNHELFRLQLVQALSSVDLLHFGVGPMKIRRLAVVPNGLHRVLLIVATNYCGTVEKEQ
jgi:hypothetical protein